MDSLPDRVLLGVVIERRPSLNPWADAVWRPVEVTEPIGGGFRLLRDGEGRALFYGGSLAMHFHRKDSDGYRRNLEGGRPLVYVVCRPGGADGTPRPFHLTACPYEAQAYAVGGEDRVEGVPMPADLAALLAAFVARHHADTPFVKRRQKPKSDGPRPAERPPGARSGRYVD